MQVPSPMVRQGRAFSEGFLGIHFSMPRWQIARTLALAVISVFTVFAATTWYHLPLISKISEFHNKMPGARAVCPPALPIAHPPVAVAPHSLMVLCKPLCESVVSFVACTNRSS